MRKLLALLTLALVCALPVAAQTRNHSLRAGRTMAYTSADGVSHPASFWCLNFAAFAIGDSTARLEFVGFHSVQAYDAGASPIQGATKSYQITPESWFTQVHIPLPAPDQTFDVNFLLAAWNVALSTIEGEPPAEGQDMRKSFFDGATPAQ